MKKSIGIDCVMTIWGQCKREVDQSVVKLAFWKPSDSDGRGRKALSYPDLFSGDVGLEQADDDEDRCMVFTLEQSKATRHTGRQTIDVFSVGTCEVRARNVTGFVNG